MNKIVEAILKETASMSPDRAKYCMENIQWVFGNRTFMRGCVVIGIGAQIFTPEEIDYLQGEMTKQILTNVFKYGYKIPSPLPNPYGIRFYVPSEEELQESIRECNRLILQDKGRDAFAEFLTWDVVYGRPQKPPSLITYS